MVIAAVAVGVVVLALAVAVLAWALGQAAALRDRLNEEAQIAS